MEGSTGKAGAIYINKAEKSLLTTVTINADDYPLNEDLRKRIRKQMEKRFMPEPLNSLLGPGNWKIIPLVRRNPQSSSPPIFQVSSSLRVADSVVENVLRAKLPIAQNHGQIPTDRLQVQIFCELSNEVVLTTDEETSCDNAKTAIFERLHPFCKDLNKDDLVVQDQVLEQLEDAEVTAKEAFARGLIFVLTKNNPPFVYTGGSVSRTQCEPSMPSTANEPKPRSDTQLRSTAAAKRKTGRSLPRGQKKGAVWLEPKNNHGEMISMNNTNVVPKSYQPNSVSKDPLNEQASDLPTEKHSSTTSEFAFPGQSHLDSSPGPSAQPLPRSSLFSAEDLKQLGNIFAAALQPVVQELTDIKKKLDRLYTIETTLKETNRLAKANYGKVYKQATNLELNKMLSNCKWVLDFTHIRSLRLTLEAAQSKALDTKLNKTKYSELLATLDQERQEKLSTDSPTIETDTMCMISPDLNSVSSHYVNIFCKSEQVKDALTKWLNDHSTLPQSKSKHNPPIASHNSCLLLLVETTSQLIAPPKWNPSIWTDFPDLLKSITDYKPELHADKIPNAIESMHNFIAKMLQAERLVTAWRIILKVNNTNLFPLDNMIVVLHCKRIPKAVHIEALKEAVPTVYQLFSNKKLILMEDEALDFDCFDSVFN